MTIACKSRHFPEALLPDRVRSKRARQIIVIILLLRFQTIQRILPDTSFSFKCAPVPSAALSVTAACRRLKGRNSGS